MVADNKDFEEEHQGISFEEQPEGYLKSIYAEAKERNDLLKPINVENIEFYEGKDKLLDERKNDKRVKRSALFIHELSPAVDSRVGDIVSRTEEREYPVTLKSSERGVDSAIATQIADNCIKLNDQLRDCGYLTDIFEEQIRAAEIYRTPSVAKIFWKNESKQVPKAINTNPMEQAMAFMSFRDPAPRVVFETQNFGSPCAEWIPPDQFLYEPNVSRFEDSSYCIHEMWLDFNDIMARAEEFGYDKKKILEFKEDMGNSNESGSSETTVSDEAQSDSGTAFKEGYRAGKYLLTESYVSTYNDTGDSIVCQAIMIGNKYLVKQVKSTDDEYPYKGIKFPFVTITITRKPGTFENYSSIDKGKYMQRLYNEGINSYLDGVSYRIFPPMKAKQNETSFREAPVYGPGEIWWLSNPEELQPVIQNVGQLPDLFPVMEGVGGKIRNVTNAPDTSQGFQASQYEKATATKVRTAGAARRSVPTNKKYGNALIGIARMFVSLNRQHGDDGVNWIHDVKVDVPSLTNVTDPEGDKQDTLLMISTMRQDPLFQSPLGQIKVRNAWEDFIRMIKKSDIDKYLPTEEELQKELDIQNQMQSAAMDNEATQQKMAMAGSLSPTQNGG